MNDGVYFTLPDKKVFLYDQYREHYFKKITALRDLCEQTAGGDGILICIENTSGFLDVQRSAVETLLQSPLFGLTFDIGHSHTAGHVDEPFILSHEDRISHFHIHDAKGGKNHLALGTGESDLQGMLKLAQKRGSRCVLEVKTIQGLRQSVGWLVKNQFIAQPRPQPLPSPQPASHPSRPAGRFIGTPPYKNGRRTFPCIARG